MIGVSEMKKEIPATSLEKPAPGIETKKRLHLGCFDVPVDGWVNTDITPHIWVARIPMAASALHFSGKLSSQRLAQHKSGIFRKVTYLNVAKKFPYPSDSFRAIFTSHMLEHLYPSVANHCIRECQRILCRGGVLRIAVPDLDKLIGSYDPADPDLALQSIFQDGKGMEKNSHHWHYNFNSLKALLFNLGFSKVERREFQVGMCPDLEKLDNRPESLFVEAFK
jgi:SAM-dependent methyltransferase